MKQSLNPANVLGIDYHRPPARRLADLPIVDAHAHVHGPPAAVARFFRVARHFGIDHVLSMTFKEEIDAIERAHPGRVSFIAIPDYRELKRTGRFRDRWLADLRWFARRGVRLCKLWTAPRARERYGITLTDPWLRPVIARAVELGMGFMVHVADPDLWFQTRYADVSMYGTKGQACEQLEWFCDHVAPRPVIAAHFAGHPESLDRLDGLLARHANLMIDTSATKWIAREISRHRPARVRRFFRAHAERILFGADLVVDEQYDWQHYASRYWVHQMLWEGGYEGVSPIADPDAPGERARLRGVGLAEPVLRAIYRDNFFRLTARLQTGAFA